MITANLATMMMYPLGILRLFKVFITKAGFDYIQSNKPSNLKSIPQMWYFLHVILLKLSAKKQPLKVAVFQ